MMEEWVDLYDENRAPLGKIARRHDRKDPGQYRLVVHICIFDRRGRLLIQRRSGKKDRWPDRWDVSAAGGVDAGESSRQGAQREVREELGLHLDFTGLRPVATVNFPGGFDDFYLVERDVPEEALRLQEDEVAEVRWALWQEVEDLVDAGAFISYPKSFLRFLFDMHGRRGFTEA